jgi:Sulfotransferase family
MFKKIIVVIGMPRSGTSWLGQIFDSSPQVAFRLSPLFSYTLKNMVNEKSSQAEFEEMFLKAYQATEDEFMNQFNRRKAGHYPVFNEKRTPLDFLVIKDTRYHHLLPRMLELLENLMVVAIVRHPCGAIYSWITHPREFPSTANPMQEWRTGACRKTGPEEFWGFEDWKKVTRLHLDLEQAYPNRFCIIQYEHLAQAPIPRTRQMFDFVGLEYTSQTQDFLIASQQTDDPDPYAVYKTPDTKDRWRNALAPEIQTEIIQEIQSTELARFLV